MVTELQVKNTHHLVIVLVLIFDYSKNYQSKTIIYGRQSLSFPLAEKETGNKSYNQSAEVGLPGDSWYDYRKPKTKGDTHPKRHRYEEI